MSWVIEKVNSNKHIFPIGEIHSSEDCPCMPELDDELVIHNSFDKREQFEIKARKPS